MGQTMQQALTQALNRAPMTLPTRNRFRRSNGCVRDTPDARDAMYAPPASLDGGSLPEMVDLRPMCPPVYDQGVLESCSGNAIAALMEFDQMRLGAEEIYVASRLFIYYNERVLEGTVKKDAGACIRTGIKTVVKLGAPHEPVWPYDPAKVFTQPPASAYLAARLDKVKSYARVGQTLPMMQACLAEGYPFLFWFGCYAGLDLPGTVATGDIPMPGPGETRDGAHFMVVVGYDNATRRFLIRNSWGTEWGDKGYGTVGYEHMLSPEMACDFWTVRG